VRPKVSDYGLQLREKQKLRKMYGIMERQFRGYFRMAERQKGVTGENLLQTLERRLDNIVYRLGFASSRSQARQFVTHGHFRVNGRDVNIPSYLLKVGDVVEIKEKTREIPQVLESITRMEGKGLPPWLEFNREKLRGKLIHIPTKEEIALPIQEQLVIELYSK
jgi:small subunit ribosomal protein S4